MIQSLVSRARGQLTLRDLAARAGTSHSTLAAYESGRVSPTTETLERILGAAGWEAQADLRAIVADPVDRGRELEAVLELASQFPARHHRKLRYPVFGRDR